MMGAPRSCQHYFEPVEWDAGARDRRSVERTPHAAVFYGHTYTLKPMRLQDASWWLRLYSSDRKLQLRISYLRLVNPAKVKTS
ncbi:hypothetical protein NDU88_006176 [Pleurodeles waltl]|uniref:Uncharacterized protein n=1 Tax=Pleurodeles waltl TaxID=8319 RepID=A0AAV7SP36_PLEWA|nr:hypothetical protein NDU88_006176 [Pleurodeles waltl]